MHQIAELAKGSDNVDSVEWEISECNFINVPDLYRNALKKHESQINELTKIVNNVRHDVGRSADATKATQGRLNDNFGKFKTNLHELDQRIGHIEQSFSKMGRSSRSRQTGGDVQTTRKDLTKLLSENSGKPVGKSIFSPAVPLETTLQAKTFSLPIKPLETTCTGSEAPSSAAGSDLDYPGLSDNVEKVSSICDVLKMDVNRMSDEFGTLRSSLAYLSREFAQTQKQFTPEALEGRVWSMVWKSLVSALPMWLKSIDALEVASDTAITEVFQHASSVPDIMKDFSAFRVEIEEMKTSMHTRLEILEIEINDSVNDSVPASRSTSASSGSSLADLPQDDPAEALPGKIEGRCSPMSVVISQNDAGRASVVARTWHAAANSLPTTQPRPSKKAETTQVEPMMAKCSSRSGSEVFQTHTMPSRQTTLICPGKNSVRSCKNTIKETLQNQQEQTIGLQNDLTQRTGELEGVINDLRDEFLDEMATLRLLVDRMEDAEGNVRKLEADSAEYDSRFERIDARNDVRYCRLDERVSNQIAEAMQSLSDLSSQTEDLHKIARRSNNDHENLKNLGITVNVAHDQLNSLSLYVNDALQKFDFNLCQFRKQITNDLCGALECSASNIEGLGPATLYAITARVDALEQASPPQDEGRQKTDGRHSILNGTDEGRQHVSPSYGNGRRQTKNQSISQGTRGGRITQPTRRTGEIRYSTAGGGGQRPTIDLQQNVSRADRVSTFANMLKIRDDGLPTNQWSKSSCPQSDSEENSSEESEAPRRTSNNSACSLDLLSTVDRARNLSQQRLSTALPNLRPSSATRVSHLEGVIEGPETPQQDGGAPRLRRGAESPRSNYFKEAPANFVKLSGRPSARTPSAEPSAMARPSSGRTRTPSAVARTTSARARPSSGRVRTPSVEPYAKSKPKLSEQTGAADTSSVDELGGLDPCTVKLPTRSLREGGRDLDL